MEKSVKRTTSTRKEIKLRRRTGVSLLLAFMMAMSLVVVAPAQLALAAPQPWPSSNIIVDGGEYTVPTTFTGTVTISTNEEVTLIGQGVATAQAFSGVSIAYTTSANLVLQNLYISSPSGNLPVIDFASARENTLSVAAGSTAILETNGYGNGAVLHVDPNTLLTISGDASTNLYIYKSSAAAAIGGNANEAAGTLNFNSGNIFIKGSQTGAVIGGDSTSATNGDITINGGQLTIEANARGAAIGASNQGECAGNVIINGGSTLINVDYTGSAIGRGESGKTVGNLYYNAGSLKVVVDPNAGSTWGTDTDVQTISNVAITADKWYGGIGSTTPADVAAIDLSGYGLNLNGMLTVTYNAGGSDITVYNATGFNKNVYSAATGYTPNNWYGDTADHILYPYLPTTATSGTIVVTDESDVVAKYSFTYSSATGFVVIPSGLYTATFAAGSYTAYVNGSAVSSTVPVPVPATETLNFVIVPTSGAAGGTVTASNGTLTNNGNGVYTLSNISGNPTISYAAGTGTAYPVIFSGGNQTTAVGGVDTTLAATDTSGNITFTPTPASGYIITGVTATNGTVRDNGDSTYTLTGVTGTSNVTIATSSSYTATFTGSNETVYVNDVAVTSASVPVATGTLDFVPVPAVGYKITSVTATNGTVSGTGNGVYTLSGVTAATTVTVATTQDTDSWSYKADTTWYTTPGSYTLTTPQQLAGLATLVNGGTDFSGSTINLGANIVLGNFEWTPIGGADSGDTFAGTFNGGNFTVSGLSITRFVPGTTSYGLFGRASGTVQNVTISGTVSTNVDVSQVGGVIGTTSGNVETVKNQVAVTVNNEASTEVGGVVGVAQSSATSSSPQTLSLLSNTAAINGRGRVGGIVGAAYAANTGGLVVDQSFNSGAITSNNVSSRSYAGGLVGYSEAVISNSYNTGDVAGGTSPYTYAGGIAGLLNGSTTIGGIASISDSFSTGTITGTTNAALWGYVDNTNLVTVGYSFWLDGQSQDTTGVTINPTGTVSSVDDVIMEEEMVGQPPYLSATYYQYQTGITTHPTLSNNPE